LPYLANTAGWLLTELGRVPWLVYGVMRLEDGVSTIVPAGSVLFSLVVYTLVYAALMVAMVYLMVKYARAGAEGPFETPEDLDASQGLPSLVGAQD